MPTLAQAIPANDLGFARIVASLWGVELESRDPADAAVELAETLCDAELLEEVTSTLTDDAIAPLRVLFDAGGRISWVAFTRQFGEVREMGPGRRDREQPHLRPVSPAEMLFYRALVARAFFETENGLQEFAFIPDDLLEALEFIGFAEMYPTVLPPAPVPTPVAAEPAPRYQETEYEEPEYADLPEPEYGDIDNFDESSSNDSESGEDELPNMAETPILPSVSVTRQPRPAPYPPSAQPKPPIVAETPPPANTPLGRLASPTEKAAPHTYSDRILDDAATLLAALRMGVDVPALDIPTPTLTALLTESGLLKENTPRPEPVKTFLETPRAKALSDLVEAWQASNTFNELRQLPGLVCEGGWSNQPLVTREFLLNLLDAVPENQWWSISAFIRDMKQRYPDYQRPAGDYDTWFIKRAADGQFLRGFSSWDEVDGALIRYIISGPLYWLGLVDLASPDDTSAPTAFRVVSAKTTRKTDENGKLSVASNNRISVPRLAPRSVRYQVARFCEWDDPREEIYYYRVTPRSLKRAAEQGLKVSHLLGLLAKHSGGQVPPAFVKALQRWEVNGTEARVETMVVLRVKRPEVLEELRASKAGRFLGEIIGPTTVLIQAGASAKVLAALAELGLLAEISVSEGN